LREGPGYITEYPDARVGNLITRMEEQNPWWKGKDLVKNDPDLRKWLDSKIKWVPEIINEVSLEPFSLNFISGPRQVGKTTLIK